MLNPVTAGINIVTMHSSTKDPIMSKKLKNEIQERTGEDGNTTVPQNVLDYVQGALAAYGVTWSKVKDAILSPEIIVKREPNPLEDRLLSTEEMADYLHVSRVTLFRYVKAGKIRAYKMGRRNLYSLSEVHQVLKEVEVSNA